MVKYYNIAIAPHERIMKDGEAKVLNKERKDTSEETRKSAELSYAAIS